MRVVVWRLTIETKQVEGVDQRVQSIDASWRVVEDVRSKEHPRTVWHDASFEEWTKQNIQNMNASFASLDHFESNLAAWLLSNEVVVRSGWHQCFGMNQRSVLKSQITSTSADDADFTKRELTKHAS